MKQSLVLSVAIAAGLAGGLASRYIAPAAAHAQQKQQPAAAIRAQSFVLVDANDNTIGTFTFEPQQHAGRPAVGPPQRIVLRDPSGREIWSAGGSGVRPVSER